ncbi:MAG: hypothetical protein ACXQS8_06645 [Candidatus Helarchaeales archaeon]
MTYFEVGTPHRRFLVSSRAELARIINTYNGKLDLHKSVYGFGSLIRKDGRLVVDPSTVIVNKIFFDLDVPSLDDVRAFFEGKMASVKKQVNFTGRGFQVFVFVKPNLASPSEAIAAAQLKIADKLGIDLMVEDNRAVIGNIRQMARITNTWSTKRRRYVIPIIEKDLELTYDEIREMAKRQRFIPVNERTHGDKILDISSYDKRAYRILNAKKISRSSIHELSLKKSENFLKDLGISPDLICDRIKGLLHPEASFSEREEIIIFCRDKLCLEPEDTARFLYNILSPRKWIHCVETGSIDRLYMKIIDEKGIEKYKYPYKNFCNACNKKACKLRYV